ncbi:MAG: hypothetical protein COA33_013805 [Fluviicola sp.]|nr:hypothetical protein [Fluviicola sp.]
MNKGVIFLLLLLFGCNLDPGSYPYAEKYELDISEGELIKKINIFKISNPKFTVPNWIGLEDTLLNHCHRVYFYYPEEKKIVYTLTRENGKNKVVFSLVKINLGDTIGNWKLINHDFEKKENDFYKRTFKDRILNKL